MSAWQAIAVVFGGGCCIGAAYYVGKALHWLWVRTRGPEVLPRPQAAVRRRGAVPEYRT